MPYSLFYLIKASGYAGSPGQSFRNHVAPYGVGGLPTEGTRMSDYKCTGWSWDTGTPPPIEEQTGYDTGQVFNMGFTFIEGSMAHYIRRLGTTVIAITHNVDSGEGSSISGSSEVTSSSNGTASVTLTSQINPLAQVDSITSQFTDYPGDPMEAPDGPHEVTWIAHTDTGAGTGTQIWTISFDYTVDIGGFNSALNKQFLVKMKDRAAVDSDFEIQWSSTGTENTTTPGDLGTGSDTFVMQDHQGQDITIWYRFRFTGSSAWISGDSNGWHVTSFTDPRLEV